MKFYFEPFVLRETFSLEILFMKALGRNDQSSLGPQNFKVETKEMQMM